MICCGRDSRKGSESQYLLIIMEGTLGDALEEETRKSGNFQDGEDRKERKNENQREVTICEVGAEGISLPAANTSVTLQLTSIKTPASVQYHSTQTLHLNSAEHGQAISHLLPLQVLEKCLQAAGTEPFNVWIQCRRAIDESPTGSVKFLSISNSMASTGTWNSPAIWTTAAADEKSPITVTRNRVLHADRSLLAQQARTRRLATTWLGLTRPGS